MVIVSEGDPQDCSMYAIGPDVYARLLKLIDESAVEAAGRRVVPERLTQNEIAARIGGSREMVSRILKDLATGGYVALEARQIVVLRNLPSHW